MPLLTNVKIPVIAFAFAAVMGCGNDQSLHPNSSTSCGSNTAVIGVHDTHLEVQCGCAETAGTQAFPPTSLTCTINAGTTVIFQFLAVAMPHQMISTDSAFVSSPLSDPSNNNKIQSHGVLFDQSGTYPFNDQFLPNMQGNIVVL